MSFWRNLLNLICTKYLKQISLKLSRLGYLTEKCKDFFANTVDFYRYDLQIYLSLLLKGQLPRTQESWSPERNCSEHHGERSLKLFNCIMKVCFYWQKQPKQWMPRTVIPILYLTCQTHIIILFSGITKICRNFKEVLYFDLVK